MDSQFLFIAVLVVSSFLLIFFLLFYIDTSAERDRRPLSSGASAVYFELDVLICLSVAAIFLRFLVFPLLVVTAVFSLGMLENIELFIKREIQDSSFI